MRCLSCADKNVKTGLNAPGFVLIPNKFKAVYFEPECWIQAMLGFGFAICKHIEEGNKICGGGD